MKILMLSDDFPPRHGGGAGMVAFRLCKTLKDLGHQIFVITATDERSEEGAIDYHGLRIFRIYSNYHQRWRAYLGLYNPQTVGKVERIIKEIKPDIVHVHNIHYYLSYHCLKIAKENAKAVFLTAHDTMLFSYGKYLPRNFNDYKLTCRDLIKQAQKRYNPFRNMAIRHYLKYVDKILAVSAGLEQALNENKIGNVELVYNGVAVKDWQVSSDFVEGFKKKYNLQNKKVIFFGGRLSYHKGGEKAMQAFVKIKKELPEAVLLIVGGKHSFTKMMEKLASDGVIFTGWLEGDELKAAYWAADLVIVPSIYFDCIPIVMIEAMACQKPVIGSRFANALEIIEDGVTGYIIDPFDIDDTAEKIIDLLKNPEKARQFGEAGYQRVKKHFSLDSQVAQTILWYQKY